MAVSTTNSFEIPPDAVKVWRGFRLPTIQLPDFFTKLGQTFVPATVAMQINAGLDTYVPTIPAGMDNKPETVPDETAILFWDSQQTYHDAFQTLAVRTYTLTHIPVYNMSISGADFPVLFNGTIDDKSRSIYLVPRSADWMKGSITHLIAGRPDGVTAAQFVASVASALSSIQSSGSLPGAVAYVGDDYLLYWALSDGTSSAGADSAGSLAKLCGWNHIVTPKNTSLPEGLGLWDKWPGMTVSSGDSFNMQFKRRWER